MHKIKHLVIVRFLVKPFGKIDIFSRETIDGRIKCLMNNLISSLNNQTNLDFEMVLMVNNSFDEELICKLDELVKNDKPKFDFIIIPYGQEVQNHINCYWENNDYVVLTRMDDDDFVNKFAVQDVRELIQENTRVPILVSGYRYGYKYTLGSSNIQKFVSEHEQGHIDIFQSFIYKTQSVPFSTQLNPYNFPHTNVVSVLEKIGHEFKVVHFDRTDGFIYFRHPFADSYALNHLEHGSFQLDIRKKNELKDTFGITFNSGIQE